MIMPPTLPYLVQHVLLALPPREPGQRHRPDRVRVHHRVVQRPAGPPVPAPARPAARRKGRRRRPVLQICPAPVVAHEPHRHVASWGELVREVPAEEEADGGEAQEQELYSEADRAGGSRPKEGQHYLLGVRRQGALER